MKTWKLRVYVGPTCVRGLARRFKDGGLTVSLEGTAHIYVQFASDALETWSVRGEFLNELRYRFDGTFGLGLADVEVLGGAY